MFLRYNRHRARGQSLVEFALILPILLMFLWGLLGTTLIMLNNISLTNASRAATRYASINAQAWSNASNPPTNTIQGQAMADAGLSGLQNNDTDIQITYWDTSTSPPTECGYFSATSDEFVPLGSYTQASCVVAGNEVQVKLTSQFNIFTGPSQGSPMPATFTISDQTIMVIEVTPSGA